MQSGSKEIDEQLIEEFHSVLKTQLPRFKKRELLELLFNTTLSIGISKNATKEHQIISEVLKNISRTYRYPHRSKILKKILQTIQGEEDKFVSTLPVLIKKLAKQTDFKENQILKKPGTSADKLKTADNDS